MCNYPEARLQLLANHILQSLNFTHWCFRKENIMYMVEIYSTSPLIISLNSYSSIATKYTSSSSWLIVISLRIWNLWSAQGISDECFMVVIKAPGLMHDMTSCELSCLGVWAMIYHFTVYRQAWIMNSILLWDNIYIYK